MKITVCIGSSCHIKGSRQVVEILHDLINQHQLSEKIDLAGTFCTGNCQKGVCVRIEEEVFSVTPATTVDFFEQHILNRV